MSTRTRSPLSVRPSSSGLVLGQLRSEDCVGSRARTCSRKTLTPAILYGVAGTAASLLTNMHVIIAKHLKILPILQD